MNGILPIFTNVDKMLIQYVRLFMDYTGYSLRSSKSVLVKMYFKLLLLVGVPF